MCDVQIYINKVRCLFHIWSFKVIWQCIADNVFNISFQLLFGVVLCTLSFIKSYIRIEIRSLECPFPNPFFSFSHCPVLPYRLLICLLVARLGKVLWLSCAGEVCPVALWLVCTCKFWFLMQFLSSLTNT